MHSTIIEAGDYHVTCIGCPASDGTFRSIAKFERRADWQRHLASPEPRVAMRSMNHRLDAAFASGPEAVAAAADYARSAVANGTILWFDEADALFTKRTHVDDGHDRY